MWVADTDFASPRPLIDALVKRSQMKMFGYGSLDTSPVQSAVTHWLATRFQLNVMPEAVVVTSSVVPALISAIVAFTEPGDKVMIQTPVYPPFHEIIGGCGRVKVTTEMRCLGAKAEEMGEPSWQVGFQLLDGSRGLTDHPFIDGL